MILPICFYAIWFDIFLRKKSHRETLNTKTVMQKKKKKVQLVIPNCSVIKESACNARDQGSIPGSGSSPGEVNGNPLQYSYLENPTDKGAWKATVHRLQ